MTAIVVKNMAASVRARLANIAKEEQRPFDSILLLYMQERLLYRLSISNYVDHFILKGGLLMFILTEYKGRPTMDMDFLARQMIIDRDRIKSVFEEVCLLSCPDDGLTFNSDSITVERIKEDADYEGVRIKIIGFLGNAKKSLQLDIGFGDIVFPIPELMTCPNLLEIGNSKINVYSVESVIAEKFQAMVVLSVVNSRMKDFYDIYTLLNMNQFDGEILKSAVFETLKRRQTLPPNRIVIFEPTFSEDTKRNAMWIAFLKKINVSDLQFPVVMKEITAFLQPIHEAILYDKPFQKIWDCEKRKWNS